MSEISSEADGPKRSRRRQYSKEERHPILAELAESKLSAAEFSRQRGIDQATLYRWRLSMRQSGGKARKATGGAKKQRPEFIQVNLTRPVAEASPLTVWAARGLELQIHQEHQVDWAVQLIQSLGAERC